MKKLLSLLTTLMMMLCMTAQAEAPAAPKDIVDTWINVRDCDVYILNADGTGLYPEKNDDTLEGTALTYTFQDNKLSVWVGILALEPLVFNYVQTPAADRLIAEDASTFFVREANYEAFAEQVRKENLQVLTSVEFWSARGVLNYISFNAYGGGWFLVAGSTKSLTWTWVDNDTVKLTVDYNGKMSITLDIINNKGVKQLVNSQTGAVAYVPK